jgi:ligand-binding SRPBCC domain-containing protein
VRVFTVHFEQWLPRSLGEVFPFFAEPLNLERITPPWLAFEVVGQAPNVMAVGARVDYRLRLRGVPFRWQSEITRWDPPRSFVDEQRRGPYRLWRHEHTFEARDGGTLVRDHVTYAVPGGPGLELLVNAVLVGPDVRRIFRYRQKVLAELVAPAAVPTRSGQGQG